MHQSTAIRSVVRKGTVRLPITTWDCWKSMTSGIKFPIQTSAVKVSAVSTPARLMSSLSNFATCDPYTLSVKQPHKIQNLVAGIWKNASKTTTVIDPLNGEPFITAPLTQGSAELQEYIDCMAAVPKSGLHNPLKNPERYLLYGDVMAKAAAELHKKEVFDFFVKCIQRTMPKHVEQAAGEINIIRRFFENFSGDSVRFLTRGFSVAGDRYGQLSTGNRWPYGPVGIITPFNFPLEIPILQMMGALMVGNCVLIKSQQSQGMPLEQFIRFLISCGLPKNDVHFINTNGSTMGQLVLDAKLRLVQFTGGSSTALKLIEKMKGRVKVEDAGFDWKIIGPDFHPEYLDYLAWQCDQDAYSISGQKCSAQSIVAMHKIWVRNGLIDKMKQLAERRSFKDFTCCPLLSHTNDEVQNHVDSLCAIPGGKLLFGGSPIEGLNVPNVYGAFKPTAVFVPLESILGNDRHFNLVTTELFGPVQVVTEYDSDSTTYQPQLLELCERMSHHLTAAVVSRDAQFLNYILSNTINGTSYAGIRARTTGAPQNHWFGPAGDPLGAGIGSPEAILMTWTCHREIVYDHGPVPSDWKIPQPT